MREHHPHKVVKFVFSTYEKTSADLKLRLRYDNLSQTKFFAGIVKLYLEKDPDMMNVMCKIKRQKRAMGKQKIKRSIEDIQRGNALLEELGITNSERQNIFDIIEMNLEDDNE